MTDSQLSLGVDPGARNTAVCVRQGTEVLYSSTWRRPDDAAPFAWAKYCADRILTEIVPLFPDAVIGVEGVESPKSHYGGKLNMLNPKNTIHTGFVAAAAAVLLPNVVIVRPGKNGSQPKDSYPDSLQGRRPKDLPGENNAGTRDHERSAYDVAGIALQLHKEQRTLDN